MPRKKSEHKREALSRSSSRSKGKRKRKSKSRSPSPLARLAVIERATEHAKAIRNLRNKASKREQPKSPVAESTSNRKLATRASKRPQEPNTESLPERVAPIPSGPPRPRQPEHLKKKLKRLIERHEKFGQTQQLT